MGRIINEGDKIKIDTRSGVKDCPRFASWIEKLANYKISKTEISFFKDIAGNFFRV